MNEISIGLADIEEGCDVDMTQYESIDNTIPIGSYLVTFRDWLRIERNNTLSNANNIVINLHLSDQS